MKFWDYVVTNPSTTLLGRIQIIAVSFVALMIWIPLVYIFQSSIGMAADPGYLRPLPSLFLTLFYGCLVAPLWEEAAYRMAPLLIAKRAGIDNEFLFPVAIISSALFGWIHGHGSNSLMMQGVMGFVFCCAFIKSDYKYWVSVVIHIGWNLFVFLI